MKLQVESRELVTIRPPATRRRPEGAPSGSGQRALVRLAPPWRAIGPAVLRQLAGIPSGPGLVVSLFVNLDPTRFALPSARETEVQAAVDAARADARRVWETLDHDSRKAVDVDLESARSFLLTGLTPDGAGAAAIFISSPRGLFQAFILDHGVPAQGRAARRPYLRPLFEHPHQGDYAVLAIDRRWAHLLLSRRGLPLHDVETIESHTRGYHASSAAQQSRIQRAVDHDTRQHVKLAVTRLVTVHRARPVQAVVLACGEEIRPVVERRLPTDLQPLLLGRVPWDPEQQGPVELARAVEPLLHERERREEATILDRLQSELGQGNGAVGTDAVIEALNRQVVETLLLEVGVEVSGAACPRCGLLSARPGECPGCGKVMTGEPDLVEAMLRRALEQSAQVRFLSFVPAHPTEPAHVAAVVRSPAHGELGLEVSV